MDSIPGIAKVLPRAKPDHLIVVLFAGQMMNAELEGSV